MEIVQVDKTNYAIFNRCNGIRKFCDYNIPKICSPFGLEEFNKITYLNLELNNGISYHSQLLGDIYKVEKELYEYMRTINGSLEWVSSIKKKDGFNPLWKIRIQKRRGRYMIKSSSAFHEIDFKHDIKIKVILQSVWIYQEKCGAIYYLDEVEQI